MSRPSSTRQGGGGELARRDERWQIRVRGLHKTFAAQHVLRGIDLDIERGKTNIIIGGSGQGKSVLMKHLMGLLKPDAGQIWVDGVDVVPFDDQEMAQAAPEVRDGVPVRGAVRLDERRREHRLPVAGAVQPAEIRGDGAGARSAQAARSGERGRHRAEVSPRAVGRSAQARRPGPRAHRPAGDPALRRADDRPRSGGHQERRRDDPPYRRRVRRHLGGDLARHGVDVPDRRSHLDARRRQDHRERHARRGAA